MGEIIGGPDENIAQDMLAAGFDWMLDHPAFEFAASGYQNVVGIIYPDNEETQELMSTIINASKKTPDGLPEATGEMIHRVMQRLAFIRDKGWNTYAEMCRKRHLEQLRQIQ
jgi:hypothetical protein